MGKLTKKSRRLPRRLEHEFAKLLGTLGFQDYGAALWDLAAAPLATPAPTDRRAISETVLSQIIEQSRHEPAVLAAGSQALPFLPSRVSSALDQHRIDVSTLFRGVFGRVQVVVVVSRLANLQNGYFADLCNALRAQGAMSFVVIVTDERHADSDRAVRERWEQAPSTHLVFWPDHNADYNVANPRLFALFLHALGPALILVGGSRVGLETIGRYGRALMRFHRLFCTFPENEKATDPPFFARYLRTASANAAILAETCTAIATLQKHGADPAGPGIEVLQPTTAIGAAEFARRAAQIFGDKFDDGRANSVLDDLLAYPRPAKRPDKEVVINLSKPADSSEPDITVTVVFHRERLLAAPALASLTDMVLLAREAGLRVEANALLDRPDEATRALVAAHGVGLISVAEVDFGDPSLTRNAGIDRARGRFAAFLDGDDLWGAQWLLRAYRAATAEDAPHDAIWHPEDVFLFYERDFDFWTAGRHPHPQASSTHFMHRSSFDPDFDAREAFMENPWSANSFARTEIFRRFRFRSTEWDWQCGIEDWRWNLETLAHGLPHLVVQDTVHIIRVKENGSLSAQHDLRGLLPILT